LDQTSAIHDAAHPGLVFADLGHQLTEAWNCDAAKIRINLRAPHLKLPSLSRRQSSTCSCPSSLWPRRRIHPWWPA